MKNTYLIFKEINGTRQLAVATQAEWDTILKENRGLPMEKRRLFTREVIADGDDLDCMYIEVSVEEYREWNSKNTSDERKRKVNSNYSVLSLDAGVPDTDLESLHESVPSEFNLEKAVIDKVLMDNLRVALRKWNPWAEEMLNIYLRGEKKRCNAFLSEKYQLTDRAIRKRKELFEKFVVRFLKK